MTQPSPLSRWLIEKLADGALPTFIARHVHARVRRTPSWSSFYSALRMAERASGDAPLGQAQTALLRDLILRDAAVERTTPRRQLAWQALAAATAAGVLFLIVRPNTVGDDAYVARGDADVRVLVRCVVGDRVVADVEARAGGVEPATLSCPDGGVLAVSATNTTPEDIVVAVEVKDAAGHASRPIVSLAVPAGAVAVLADDGVRLDRATGDGVRRLRLIDAVTGAPRSRTVEVVIAP